MLLVPLLFACATMPPAPDVPPITGDEVQAAVAKLFCQAADSAKTPCTPSASAAVVGRHTVAFEAVIDGFLVLPPKTLGMGAATQQIPGEVQLSAAVTAFVDGAPLLTAVASEAGSHADMLQARSGAVDATAQRWMVATGIAVLDAVTASPDAAALGALGMAAPPQIIGETGLQGWAAYPILTGQGFDPKVANQLGPAVQGMVRALAPYLTDTSADGLHAVRVKAKLGGGGAPGKCGVLPPALVTPGETVSIVPLTGTVTVDGKEVGDICPLSQAVGWPLPRPGAILEWDQVVVVGPATAQPAPEAPAPPQ